MPCVIVSTENRQGNKKMTRVAHLEIFGVQPNAVQSVCAKQFSGSASLVEIKGGKNSRDRHDITLQGDHAQDMADFLMQRFGVPRAYITISRVKGKANSGGGRR